MKDEQKTKAELIAELKEMRQRLASLQGLQNIPATQREELLLNFVEQLADGVVIMDESGEIIVWNKATEDYSGLSAEELSGKPIWELQNDSTLQTRRSADAIKKSVLSFYETGDATWLNKSYTSRYQLPDGSYTFLDDRKFAIQTRSGTFLAGILRDVTQLEETKRKLEESEDRLSKVRLAANDGIWDWDLLTNEVYFGPRYYAMAGYDENELENPPMSFKESVHPDDLERVMNEIQAILDGKLDRFVSEFRFKKKDGSWLWVLGRGVIAALDADGKPTRFIGTNTDITRQVNALERLRESEEKFRLLANYTLDWEYWIDRKSGEYLYISPSCKAITGYAPEEIVNDSNLIFEMVDDLHRDAVRRHYLVEAKDLDGLFSMQFPIKAKDGEERWIEHRCQPIFDADGNNIGRRGNNRDITERKQSEFALLESEQKFSRSFYAHPTPMQIINLTNQTHVGVNDSFCKLFGYERDEIVGKAVSDIRLMANAFDDERSWALLQSQGELRNYPVAMLTKSGDKKQGLLSAAKIELRNETLLIGSFVDITKRVQAEEQLKLQAHALRAAADGIAITNSAGTILWVNPAFSRLTGYSFDEALGNNPRVLKSGQHDEAFYKKMWATITQGKVWRGEIINQRKDGSLYPEEMTIAPLVTEDNRINNFVAIKQDISERKSAQKVAEQHLSRLMALRKIDQAIANTLDLRVTLNILLRYLREQLGVDAAVVLSYDKLTQSLSVVQEQGLPHTKGLHPKSLHIGEGYAGKVAEKRAELFIPDLSKDNTPIVERFIEKGFRFYLGVPLISKGELTGVLQVIHRSTLTPDDEWRDYLHTVAGQAALAIDNSALFNDLQRSNMNLIRAYDETIKGWAQALELRDMETVGHSQRVVAMTLDLAKSFGIKNEQLLHIQRGALLHDIGKMGIPDAILQKPGKLTDDEWVIMKKHPEYAFEWLSPIDYLRPSLDIPHYHHEKWDGSGYPVGLVGRQIPLSARIFTIVDVWDALRSDRPYRTTWSYEKTLTYIQELSGIQFDPEVVRHFSAYLESTGYRFRHG